LIRLTASSFELSNDQSTRQSLSGYICVDDNNNSKSFQLLKDLCTRNIVDEVVVVYREYAFSLTRVSFSDNDIPCQGTDHTFKFHARDVHLEGLFAI
jgi:hypothetical protein